MHALLFLCIHECDCNILVLEILFHFSLARMAAFTNFREKFMLWVRKHEKLCQICFKVLLNLADDRRTESKMVAKDIVKMLVSVVIREKVRNPHLLVVCLDFLKRLSILQVLCVHHAHHAGVCLCTLHIRPNMYDAGKQGSHAAI